MNPIIEKLEGIFRAAANIPDGLEVIRPSDRPDLSDFQSNIALALAKMQKRNPRDVAQEIIGNIKDPELTLAIDGPGFINIKLSPKFVEDAINEIIAKPNLGLPPPAKRLKIVVDYGGPNVAKALHVGHLRPAIIGESMKRLARFLGHEVIGDTHLGDWGLPMGMVIASIKEQNLDPASLSVADLNKLYPAASARSKTDEAFAKRAADETKKLQGGDKENFEIWRKFVATSTSDMKRIYSLLNVEFDLWLGESDAAASAEMLREKFRADGHSRVSQGAEVIDIGEDLPFRVTNSNGQLLYAMTDVGTIFDRMRDIGPDLILYHTDARQNLHFKQVFKVAEKTGVAQNAKLEHLPHGNILGENGTPLKTRSGDTLPLEELITEAIAKAKAKSKNPAAAQDIAIAAIKFADFINPRINDYVLNLDKFTSFEGKTGPYILYTAVRIKSMLRQAAPPTEPHITLAGDHDRALAIELCGFADAVQKSFDSRALHILTQYVYALAVRFNAFYHSCHVLTQPDENLKNSWLALANATLEVFDAFAQIAAINIPEEM
ncbi:MAG: arginine--tRNA ligase [Rickettsiales bacterium]|jgi:arginyl-tRNA synthetase|nr:arginine--tRNA ligase [Rickettsiales bacterium]